MSGGIVILGAGPTGLGAAYRLRERGEDAFEIFERSGHSPPLEEPERFQQVVRGFLDTVLGSARRS